MINAATKAKSNTISEEPRAYRMLENLSISRGMTTPRLMVMETPVMNAFASGIRPDNYQVTLTRGLMDALDDEELEAVIAHELSHIRHKDVRMLIIAVIFVGIFAFVGEMLFRNMFRVNLARSNNHRRSRRQCRCLDPYRFRDCRPHLCHRVDHPVHHESETRIYGGCRGAELTKNPDAMIRALQKISGNAELETVPDEVREMAIYNPKAVLQACSPTRPLRSGLMHSSNMRVAVLGHKAAQRDAISRRKSKPNRVSATTHGVAAKQRFEQFQVNQQLCNLNSIQSAPLRRLSDTTHISSVLSCVLSSRIRDTKVANSPTHSIGVTKLASSLSG